jgi:membrane-bound inhibitor of C-type lysozyme
VPRPTVSIALALALAGAALSACSDGSKAEVASGTDINAVATAAQGDIDTYAGNTLAAPAAAVMTTIPAPPAPPAPLPSSAATDTANAAGAVVRDYYALIAARRYADAYRLWDDDGRASGMSAAAFADSFAKYATYGAQVGATGRIDAGAGQRYVEIPVRIAGRLTDGDRPFVLAGTLTLHRVADIDGATAAQRRWRIRDSSIRPDPVAAARRTDATYACAGDTRISVRFDADNDTATIDRDRAAPVVLTGQRAASGIWYRAGGYELRGKGRAAQYTAPGAAPVACTAG